MSSSKCKFLLDENVRIELLEFLTNASRDVQRVPLRLKNGAVAAFSLQSKRVVVTNDWDFTQFAKDDIMGVIWLKIPQDDPETLVRAFSRLLATDPELTGRLVVLYPDRWDIVSLPLEVRFPTR